MQVNYNDGTDYEDDNMRYVGECHYVQVCIEIIILRKKECGSFIHIYFGFTIGITFLLNEVRLHIYEFEKKNVCAQIYKHVWFRECTGLKFQHKTSSFEEEGNSFKPISEFYWYLFYRLQKQESRNHTGWYLKTEQKVDEMPLSILPGLITIQPAHHIGFVYILIGMCV